MDLFFGLLGLLIALISIIYYSSSSRLFRPPLIISGVFAFYIFPKVIALSLSEGPAASFFQKSGAVTTVSYMALLGYSAFILSYGMAAPRFLPIHQIRPVLLPYSRLLNYSALLGSVGLLAHVSLIISSGGFTSHYLQMGFYNAEFTGFTVWLIFLSRFIYPALACIALLVAFHPTKPAIWLLILLAAFPLLNVILLYRRSDLLFVGFIALFALGVSRRMKFKRIHVLMGMSVMVISILLFPYLRQETLTQVSGHSYGIENISTVERIVDSFEVTDDDEIVRAASMIEVTYRSGDYGWGTFVWNSMVDQFVPGTLIGEEKKGSLYIGKATTETADSAYFDSDSYYYVAPMGFAEAYREFGPFGWIIFGLLGYGSALVERRSAKLSDIVFLMVGIPIVCLAASNDLSSIPARLFAMYILTRALGSARFLSVPPPQIPSIQSRQMLLRTFRRGLK